MEHAFESILEATQTASLWPQALRTLARTAHSDHAFVHFVKPQAMHTEASRGAELMLAEFLRGDWGHRNSRMRRGLQMVRGGFEGPLTDWRLFRPEETRIDPFEQEFASKHDISHYIGSFLPLADGYLVLSIERGPKHGAYVNGQFEEISKFLRLLSATMRYCQQARIDVARGVMDTFADRAGAFAWVGSTGCLFTATAAFEALAGKVIDVRAGYVRALDKSVDESFRSLIAQAGLGIETPRPVDLGAVGERRAMARAIPMRGPARDLAGGGDVLLSIVLEGAPEISLPAALTTRFGLTPSEARLAIRIAQGETLRSAAEAEGITFETARSRLKVVFYKTSTSRQLELVLLVRKMEDEKAGRFSRSVSG